MIKNREVTKHMTKVALHLQTYLVYNVITKSVASEST